MTFPRNKILDMIQAGQAPLGMQCFTGHPSLIEVMAYTGYDFVMIDSEHSPNNSRAMEESVRAADAAGLTVFVRVSTHKDESDIHRALEAGAHGIFLPLVESAEDVRNACDAAFFPPKGHRGICPSVRAARYNWRTFDDYMNWNNDQMLMVPMIERVEAVEDIDAICALEDIHLLVFAAGDLAVSMGERTRMMESPLVREAYRKVIDAAKRHDVAVIGGPILDPTAEGCRKAAETGVSVFCLGLDIMGFRTFCESAVAALAEGLEGTGLSRPPAPQSGFKR